MGPNAACYLSQALRAPAISFAYSFEGKLTYALAFDGQLRDTYEYEPDLIEREILRYALGDEFGGDADLLALAAGRPGTAPEFAALLTGTNLDSYSVLEGVATLLGLENWFVTFRYMYPGGPVLSMIQEWDQFVSNTREW